MDSVNYLKVLWQNALFFTCNDEWFLFVHTDISFFLTVSVAGNWLYRTDVQGIHVILCSRNQFPKNQ